MALTFQAPAKLNRFLAVLGRRADGFHDLQLVTSVLHDVPELTDTMGGEVSQELTLTISGPTAHGLVADESNLVLRAWRLLEDAAKRTLPAALRLEKRIPHGAGLGGGSSDAATALRLGNQMFSLGLKDEALLSMAAQLGSDVPLFLLGGTVLGLDRGDRVFPLRPVPLEPILLVHPGLHVSTPSVYQALLEVGYPDPQPLESQPSGAAPPWRNDLTEAALRVCPALTEVREALLRSGGEPLLCGSGSCWAARFSDGLARDAAANALRKAHPGWGIWRV